MIGGDKTMTEDIIVTEALFGLIGKKKDDNVDTGLAFWLVDNDEFEKWNINSRPASAIGDLIKTYLKASAYESFKKAIANKDDDLKTVDNSVFKSNIRMDYITKNKIEACKIIDTLILKLLGLSNKYRDEMEDIFAYFISKRIKPADEKLAAEIMERANNLTDSRSDEELLKAFFRIFDEYYERLANLIRGGK